MKMLGQEQKNTDFVLKNSILLFFSENVGPSQLTCFEELEHFPALIERQEEQLQAWLTTF